MQLDLRKRATAKFTRANEMLFEREALEQATHEKIADYHASRFPEGATIYDLTAGIGADLMAFSKRGEVVGFELDADRAELARFNSGAEVREEDSVAWLEANSPDYVFVDPHRRSAGGQRLTRPEDYQPDPMVLAPLLARTKLSGMKLSPLLRDDYLTSLGPRVEFVEFDGECREACVWMGSEVEPWHGAVHAGTGETLEQHELEDVVNEPGKWLYDASPAAIRAHCLGHFGIPQLGESPGYLTGDTEIISPWLRRYEVLYHGRGDSRTTRQALRNLGLRAEEVKQRGAGVDGSKLMRELKCDGEPCSVVAWLVGKSVRHALCKRVP